MKANQSNFLLVVTFVWVLCYVYGVINKILASNSLLCQIVVY